MSGPQWTTRGMMTPMTRILYGVSGEGSGHSSRAREVLRHLRSRGHDLLVVSYDRGHRNLREEFEVLETEGLHITTADNKVAVARTFADNLRRLPAGMRKLREVRQRAFEEFQPEVVLTDFEPMTAYLARHEGLPLVSIDNQHRMRYMRLPEIEGLEREAKLTRAVIRAMVPSPDAALITTFWMGEVTRPRAWAFAPILRREVRELAPSDGDHVLVYFTKGYDSFQEQLTRYPRERFVIYGAGREGSEGNCTWKAPSQEGFLADLASCKAVVATAGFTLMTEAMHLGKPYLALPMRGQFEQELNAHLLDELGYGVSGREAGEREEILPAFLYRLPELAARLDAYPREGEGPLFSRLDELVEDGGAGARELRAQRRGSA